MAVNFIQSQIIAGRWLLILSEYLKYTKKSGF